MSEITNLPNFELIALLNLLEQDNIKLRKNLDDLKHANRFGEFNDSKDHFKALNNILEIINLNNIKIKKIREKLNEITKEFLN